MGGEHDRDIQRIDEEIKELRRRGHARAQVIQTHEGQIGVLQKEQLDMKLAIDGIHAMRQSAWRRWEDRILGCVVSLGGTLIYHLMTK